jgi:hypothetical protein
LLGWHARHDSGSVHLFFCDCTALGKSDLAAFHSVPLMIGVEVVGAHHYFGHHRWVMVWVTPREVTRTTIGHNHAT